MRHERQRMFGATLAACLLVFLAACESEASREAKRKQEVEALAYRERYAKAEALFRERCKTAGAVIHRTVKDVEGIELKKIRPKLEFGDKRYFDPMWEGAAMAGESGGEGYIWTFLLSEFRHRELPDQRGGFARPDHVGGASTLPGIRGYLYIDFISPVDGLRHRYSLRRQPEQINWNGELVRRTTREPAPRYAVDYEDLTDPADRAYWIAGTVIRVIDQQTGEVIGQMTRYVWDQGFGSASTGRWPWQHAASSSTECPEVQRNTHVRTRMFVDTVLIPKQGD